MSIRRLAWIMQKKFLCYTKFCTKKIKIKSQSLTIEHKAYSLIIKRENISDKIFVASQKFRNFTSKFI